MRVQIPGRFSIVIFVFILSCESRVGAGTDSQSQDPPTITIRVQTPSGKPLPNVTVIGVDPSTHAVLKGATVEGGSKRWQTDAGGRFEFPAGGTNLAVLMANENGFSLVQSSDLMDSPKMLVQPWGSIEGVRLNKNQPISGKSIEWMFDWRCAGPNIDDRIWTVNTTMTDSEGRFTFDHVPPIGIDVMEAENGQSRIWDGLEFTAIKPGENKFLRITTEGRKIVGQIKPYEALPENLDLRSCEAGLVPVSAHHGFIPVIPKQFDTPEKRTEWWENWYQSETGRQTFVPLDKRGSTLEVGSNGFFTSETVVAPGEYWVNGGLWQNGNKVANIDQYVQIPSGGTDGTNDSFDIGSVILKPTLRVGDLAPDFHVTTLDGKPLKLSDFRGKYVLLDFWATWCAPCVAEIPDLQSTYDAFGKDTRFMVVGLSLDENSEAPEKFLRGKNVHWLQGFLGDWGQDKVTKKYEISAIPSIWLLGPDGTIISRNLRGPEIKKAVTAALAAK